MDGLGGLVVFVGSQIFARPRPVNEGGRPSFIFASPFYKFKNIKNKTRNK